MKVLDGKTELIWNEDNSIDGGSNFYPKADIRQDYKAVHETDLRRKMHCIIQASTWCNYWQNIGGKFVSMIWASIDVVPSITLTNTKNNNKNDKKIIKITIPCPNCRRKF
jgi:hypothetical protein